MSDPLRYAVQALDTATNTFSIVGYRNTRITAVALVMDTTGAAFIQDTVNAKLVWSNALFKAWEANEVRVARALVCAGIPITRETTAAVRRMLIAGTPVTQKTVQHALSC